MYKTNNDITNKTSPEHEKKENFDWELFFSAAAGKKIIDTADLHQIVTRAREHLKEDKYRLTLTLNTMMRKLLAAWEPHNPRILELGAATGFLTRWLTEEYSGTGVLVDNSEASFQAFNTMNYDRKQNLTYLKADLFTLELAERFDLVCSFGLIEHFSNKHAVLEIHRKFAAPGGIIVIIVPMDTPLTRTFFELHPELNLGYRELLKERELKDLLAREGMSVFRTQASSGYSYDFLGALVQSVQK